MSPDASTAWTYTYDSLEIAITVHPCHCNSNHNAIGEVRGIYPIVLRYRYAGRAHFFSRFAGEDGRLG